MGSDVIVTSPSRGPRVSYPAIEKRYGKSIADWMEIVASSPLTKHSELVGWLKAEHGVGHGHATALVHQQKQD